jgi:hypothetical protein
MTGGSKATDPLVGMATTDTLDIAHRFKLRFVAAHAEDIRRVVEEARFEAVGDARVIIRNFTLEQLLAEIAAESAGAGQVSPTQPVLASSPDEIGRRVVVELDAIRAQIAHNEEVLLRIRPANASAT